MRKWKLGKLFDTAEVYACWLGSSVTLEAACLGLLIRGELPIEWYTYPVLILNAIAIFLLIKALVRIDKEFKDELK